MAQDGADLTLSQPNTNVCLKAFTSSGSTPVAVTKPASSGWQTLKNLTRPSSTVKSNVARVYLNTGPVNQSNPVSRVLAGQVYPRNTLQSFAPAPESYISRYRMIAGNVSSSGSPARSSSQCTRVLIEKPQSPFGYCDLSALWSPIKTRKIPDFLVVGERLSSCFHNSVGISTVAATPLQL